MSSLDDVEHVCSGCGKPVSLKYDKCWRCNKMNNETISLSTHLFENDYPEHLTGVINEIYDEEGLIEVADYAINNLEYPEMVVKDVIEWIYSIGGKVEVAPKMLCDAYDNTIWHAGTMEGCTGYQKGLAEWCVHDDDGGIVMAFCPNREYAEIIAEKLNGKPTRSEAEQLIYEVDMEVRRESR